MPPDRKRIYYLKNKTYLPGVKKKVLKLAIDGDFTASIIAGTKEEFMSILDSEIDTLDSGDELYIKLDEMDENDFKNLEEFPGW